MKFILTFVMLILSSFAFSCSSQVPAMAQNRKAAQESLDSQLESLSDQIVVSLSQKQKSKIAIIEFSDLQGNVTNFGRYLAEELITRLYLTNKFEVIERQLLNKVLQEHQLNLSGLIDVNSAQELGRILGVDAIASGSVTDLGRSVKVNARLISTQTGKVFSVASVTIGKDDAVQKLMGEFAAAAKSPAEPDRAGPDSFSEPPQNRIVEQNGFTFELVKSKMEFRKVTCSLIIKNNSESETRLRTAIAGSKLFDESGNEYSASRVKVANSVSKKGWRHLDKVIVPGVPTKAELVFENVSSAATKISLLNIRFEDGLGNVKFYDVPLEVVE